MGSANERYRYSVTASLIGWSHTQNDPCFYKAKLCYHRKKRINLWDIYYMNCHLSKQECAHEINFLMHAISWKSYIMNLRPQSNVTNVMYMTEGECICICTCKINTFLGKAIWLTRIKQSQTNITSKKADIKPILYTGTLWGELFWIARK